MPLALSNINENVSETKSAELLAVVKPLAKSGPLVCK